MLIIEIALGIVLGFILINHWQTILRGGIELAIFGAIAIFGLLSFWWAGGWIVEKISAPIAHTSISIIQLFFIAGLFYVLFVLPVTFYTKIFKEIKAVGGARAWIKKETEGSWIEDPFHQIKAWFDVFLIGLTLIALTGILMFMIYAYGINFTFHTNP